MSKNISIRYESITDKNTIKEVMKIEKLPTMPKLITFLLYHYKLSKTQINRLNSRIIALESKK
ncbi:MAG: hypothetical protein ACI9Q3_001021 [Maribacter sp.]|jgi:hypothetical protein